MNAVTYPQQLHTTARGITQILPTSVKMIETICHHGFGGLTLWVVLLSYADSSSITIKASDRHVRVRRNGEFATRAVTHKKQVLMKLL